jgi:Zn-dependent protease with chaperone function
MVAPGGKVVVYTGLLRMMATEKELAAVLAHECAHVLARHTAEKVTSMQAATLVRSILYWAFGVPLPAGEREEGGGKRVCRPAPCSPDHHHPPPPLL